MVVSNGRPYRDKIRWLGYSSLCCLPHGPAHRCLALQVAPDLRSPQTDRGDGELEADSRLRNLRRFFHCFLVASEGGLNPNLAMQVKAGLPRER